MNEDEMVILKFNKNINMNEDEMVRLKLTKTKI